ncbi:amidohydrolase family protein [Rhizobium etli]|uniref:amidohydrolase family protein n=1 Tax=Rhizobium etli TaxID=29449 RepID=UPI0004072744|nr:amidohydrolase family protein [Rhizobium etli]
MTFENDSVKYRDLAEYVRSTRMCSTHEHTEFETAYLQNPPDILGNLFDNYIVNDLIVAGASTESVQRLFDPRLNVRDRFQGVAEAWQRSQFTGYGQGVRLIAEHVYGVSEMTGEALDQHKFKYPGKPGERLQLLRDVANLDHVQIDSVDWNVPSEAAGQDFFLYDINLCRFCDGTPDLDKIGRELQIEVTDLTALGQAIELIFDRNGPLAVAVKSQHAYHRTLRWQKRDETNASQALETWIRDGANTSIEAKNCLGDWCIDKIAYLATEHNLPFKIHTGYLNNVGGFQVKVSSSECLHELMHGHPQTRFVLMHIAYPYEDELVAVAKQFPNVAVDLCWAWSLNPLATSRFVLSMINAVPSNKIFAFGGDSRLPAASVGYAFQARIWLLKTLESAVNDGWMTERQAIEFAERLMVTNQYEFFDLADRKARLRTAKKLHLKPSDGSSIKQFDAATHSVWNTRPEVYGV